MNTLSALIDHRREKLLNLIIYFARNTEVCGKTKLFKLLYFLDFEHFKQTGRSVTGQSYYAWKKGPVPATLYYEFQSPYPDMLSKVRLKTVPSAQGDMQIPCPLVEFNDEYFSDMELELMERLALQYRKARSNQMIEATHAPDSPWYKIYSNAKGNPIPYESVLESLPPEERAIVEELAKESQEMRDNYL